MVGDGLGDELRDKLVDGLSVVMGDFVQIGKEVGLPRLQPAATSPPAVVMAIFKKSRRENNFEPRFCVITVSLNTRSTSYLA
jgi:hypothetical protein